MFRVTLPVTGSHELFKLAQQSQVRRVRRRFTVRERGAAGSHRKEEERWAGYW